MKLLITGGCGFVARHLVNHLINEFTSHSIEIILCDKINKVEWVDDFEATNIKHEHLDILNFEQVSSNVKKYQPDFVIHLAAIAYVPASDSNLELAWRVNTVGTHNLLEATNKHSPATKFIYISSGEVYGRSFNLNKALTEDEGLLPNNTYSLTKIAAESLCQLYSDKGLYVVIMRPFNHLGPGQDINFVSSSFASKIANIESKKSEQVIHVGNLDIHRDFLDVRDVVSAYCSIITKIDQVNSGEVFNICSEIPRKIKDILEFFIESSGLKIDVRIDQDKLRPSEVPSTLGSSEKLKTQTGWEKRIPWETSLTDVLNYWRHKIHI